MSFSPKTLAIPPTEATGTFVRLRLNYTELGSWTDLSLLAIPKTSLPALMQLVDAKSTTAAVDHASEMLKKWQTAVFDVPLLGGTEPNIQCSTPFDVLLALEAKGHLWLPLLSTWSATRALMERVGATPRVPGRWRLESD